MTLVGFRRKSHRWRRTVRRILPLVLAGQVTAGAAEVPLVDSVPRSEAIMEKPVKVYFYTVFNAVTGRKLRRGPATLEAIEKDGGKPEMETETDIDDSELDEHGFARRKPQE